MAERDLEKSNCCSFRGFVEFVLGVSEEKGYADFCRYVCDRGWKQALEGNVPAKKMREAQRYAAEEVERVAKYRAEAGLGVWGAATLMIVLVNEERGLVDMLQGGDEPHGDARKERFGQLRRMLEEHAKNGGNTDAYIHNTSCFGATVGLPGDGKDCPEGTKYVLVLKVVEDRKTKVVEIPVNEGLGMLRMEVRDVMS